MTQSPPLSRMNPSTGLHWLTVSGYSQLNTERRLNVKLSDDNSSVQRNLRMVHKLLIDEREALSRILDAARKVP